VPACHPNQSLDRALRQTVFPFTFTHCLSCYCLPSPKLRPQFASGPRTCEAACCRWLGLTTRPSELCNSAQLPDKLTTGMGVFWERFARRSTGRLQKPHKYVLLIPHKEKRRVLARRSRNYKLLRSKDLRDKQWRRRESNPRPEIAPRPLLRV